MVATRSKTRAPSATIKPASDIPAPARRAGPNPTRNTIRRWSHIPSRLTVTWLTISLPLVAWDTGYVLGRPHTMIGGKWHDPIWTPYGLYSNVDLVYGLKALDENNGFTAAQSTMNIIESGMYILYLLIIGLSARRDAKGRRALRGRNAGFAMLLGFGASLMTLSKTLLYGEYLIRTLVVC